VLWEKTEMVPPSIFLSKTNEFTHQQHVAPLKLRNVAAEFIFFYFLFFFNFKASKKKKNVSVAAHPHVDQRAVLGVVSATPKTGLGTPTFFFVFLKKKKP